MKHWIALTGLIASTSTLAAQIVTLEDGRQVRLNDDFTWQYMVKDTAPTDATPMAAAAIATSASVAEATPAANLVTAKAIPLADRHVGTLVTPGADKPTLQLSDSGVNVLLGAAQYQDGQLVIPTSITNQQISQSVILINLELVIADANGQVLTTETLPVWQSIKRMADTYLRPRQSADGRLIKLKVPQAEQYQISAKIVEVTTR